MSSTLEDQWQYRFPEKILSLVLIVWLGYFVCFLQDEDMHFKGINVYAMARTSNLNEELGQVRASPGLRSVMGASQKVDSGRACAEFKC